MKKNDVIYIAAATVIAAATTIVGYASGKKTAKKQNEAARKDAEKILKMDLLNPNKHGAIKKYAAQAEEVQNFFKKYYEIASTEPVAEEEPVQEQTNSGE